MYTRDACTSITHDSVPCKRNPPRTSLSHFSTLSFFSRHYHARRFAGNCFSLALSRHCARRALGIHGEICLLRVRVFFFSVSLFFALQQTRGQKGGACMFASARIKRDGFCILKRDCTEKLRAREYFDTEWIFYVWRNSLAILVCEKFY